MSAALIDPGSLRAEPSLASARRRIPRLGSCAAIWFVVGIAFIASARDSHSQPAKPLSDIVKHPGDYLGRAITWRNGYCFVDKPSYVCIGKDLPFEVTLSQDIPTGTAKFSIDENCGDINGAERNPVSNCAFSFEFVADKFEFIQSDYFIGEKLQQNKRVVRFLARSLKPSK